MAERLLLEGQFSAKMRKIGVVGIALSAISGVATYCLVKNRENKVKEYFRTLSVSSPHRQATNSRIATLASGNYDAMMAGIKEQLGEEAEEIFDTSFHLFLSELYSVEKIEPSVKDTICDLYTCAITGEEEPPEYLEVLTKAREKLGEAVRTGHYANDSIQNKMWVQYQYQLKKGVHDADKLLAKIYTPAIEVEFD